MVNILPYFAPRGQDALVAQQRDKAHQVYDLLKDSSYLGKQVSPSTDPQHRSPNTNHQTHLWVLPPGTWSAPPSVRFSNWRLVPPVSAGDGQSDPQ